jgi:class 3 adenylate cyclase
MSTAQNQDVSSPQTNGSDSEDQGLSDPYQSDSSGHEIGDNSPLGARRPPPRHLVFNDKDSGIVSVADLQGPITPSLYPKGIAEARRPSIIAGLQQQPQREESSSLMNVVNDLSALDLALVYQLQSSRRGSLPSRDYPLQENSRLPRSMSTLAGELIGNDDITTTTGSCLPCDCWTLPHFTKILENLWKEKATDFLHRRYRLALVFMGLFALLWIVFFSVQLPLQPETNQPISQLTSDLLALQSVKYSAGYIIGAVLLFFFLLFLLLVTFWKHYRKIALVLSILLSVVLMAASCALAISILVDDYNGISTISSVAQFALSAIVVLIVYTLSTLDIRISVVICTVYVIILEGLSAASNIKVQNSLTVTVRSNYMQLFSMSTTGRLLFHVCLNIAGISTAYISQRRLRDTFWKIAQCVLSRRLLDNDRDIKEKIIHSILPQVFAEDLLSAPIQLGYMFGIEKYHEDTDVLPFQRPLAIPFRVCSMERVSILFSDIVGFTKFSSSLSAVELVGILNEIFSEFDELALRNKCEKITTLGDSYICVSGCPKPDAGHATNCVEMGLAIIKSLEEFRSRSECNLDMRIGIHTGSVTCGVLGMKRFKFDVWSKDVTIANRVETAGVPGRVVITSSTRMYLSSAFITEEYISADKPIELQDYKLFFAYKHSRKSARGSTSAVWKDRIKAIESIGKGEDQVDNSAEESKNKFILKHVLQEKTHIADEAPSSNLRDSLSRQSHLQQCATYTETTNAARQNDFNIDVLLVELMEEEKVNFDSYFDPRLKLFTAFFSDKELEARYRNYGRDLVDPQKGTNMEAELGFNLTKLSYLLDVVTLITIFLLIMIGSAISLAGGSAFSDGSYISWLIIFIFGLITHSIILTLVIAVYAPHRFPKKFASLSQIMINWYVRSFVALYLIYYPMCIVIVTLTQCYSTGFSSVEDLLLVQMSLYITIVVLICSINFMGVIDIAKIVGGICSSALTVALVSGVHLEMCAIKLNINETLTLLNAHTNGSRSNITVETPLAVLKNYYNKHITPEAVILFMLILGLLIVVNRMSEVSVRLSFIGRIEAAANKQFTKQQKNQVEWLLYNIIPPHVCYELRNSGRYSRNHDCVGIMFASIVNFNDILHLDGDEDSFRLLNHLIREYDMLLNQQNFSSLDKIKTIGSTYMVASGLQLVNAEDKISHLLQLIDFALRLNDVLYEINKMIPAFAFRLRVGFNYGPVTSGVVGSRKLMFDIWGDAVNVASRMDSTGKVFHIHMPEKCLELLDPYITWEFNRIVDVKGKGSMRTVFVTGRR